VTPASVVGIRQPELRQIAHQRRVQIELPRFALAHQRRRGEGLGARSDLKQCRRVHFQRLLHTGHSAYDDQLFLTADDPDDCAGDVPVSHPLIQVAGQLRSGVIQIHGCPFSP
jgi:hypothetical protein